ncbi:MAG: lipopolysaccharide kinase InaA family protein [Candidatus Dojkabacteria bacterium]
MSNLIEAKLTGKNLSPEELPSWIKGREKFFYTDIADRISIAGATSNHLAKLIEVRTGELGEAVPVTEEIENAQTLYKWVNDNEVNLASGLNKEFLTKIIYALSDGLIGLHAVDVVHRDVNPTNYLISDFENIADSIVLSDFDIAQINGGSNVDFGEGIGTPGYVPNDQILSNWIVYPSMDQFSLALTLIFLLTGGSIDPYNTDIAQTEIINEGYWQIATKYNREIANVLARALKLAREEMTKAHYYRHGKDPKDDTGRYESVVLFRDELLAAVKKLS